jgi:hypothetical protein
MEVLKQFETYIAAQKATGIQFIIFGVLLLVAAVLLHFSQLNPITQGLRNGFFVISMLLIASGVGFTLNQNKLSKTKTEVYQADEVEFKNQEVERMHEVYSNVPKIIFGLSITLILLILALMFFIHPPFWKGVSFSVAIYLLGLLILESISFLSVKNYLESLLN